MKINIFKFTINNHENFLIHLDDVIHYGYQSYVSLFIDGQEIVIGKSIIADFAQELKNKLELGLSGKLKLDDSFEKNIGYYWNQDLNEEDPPLFLIEGKESKYWVGYTYLLWTTDSQKKDQRFATWMYNDELGNIVFDVTPTYPDTFIDPQDSADLQAYEEWMKMYKPFFTRTIPKDVAKQWLHQANMILKTIKKNTKLLEFEDDSES